MRSRRRGRALRSRKEMTEWLSRSDLRVNWKTINRLTIKRKWRRTPWAWSMGLESLQIGHRNKWQCYLEQLRATTKKFVTFSEMSDLKFISTCGNGGCTRPRYRGKYCFRCWAGTKWTAIVDRKRSDPSYRNVPIGFTRAELIAWVMDNPPPINMERPSIDRIIDSAGYVPGNIRWLESHRNSRKRNKDLPDEMSRCSRCGLVQSRYKFPPNRSASRGHNSYCRKCYRITHRQWEASKK